MAAFGTNQTEICMFSPSQGNVVGTLQGGHDAAIRDFRFLESDYSQGFSIGEDAKLVQWDLRKSKPIRYDNLQLLHRCLLTQDFTERSLSKTLISQSCPTLQATA